MVYVLKLKKLLKSICKIALSIFVFFAPVKLFSQHHSQLSVEANLVTKTLNIQQEITFFNQSDDTLRSIVLNDWNNAYSEKNTPLAKRFSDEFYKGFHLAKDRERGSTNNLTIIGPNKLFLNWERTEKNPDFIEVELREKLANSAYEKIKSNVSTKILGLKFKEIIKELIK